MGQHLSRLSSISIAVGTLGSALMVVAPAAVAEPSPVMHWGSDTRAKSQPQCMTDADFAIRATDLQVTFNGGDSVAGSGNVNGAGVSVLVTCVSVGSRTFIQVVGLSLDCGAAEETRNRVRTIAMGAPS
jgi:hypothetical protein